jgi:two-component system, NarL family, sensor histidine kinase UhpB
LKLRTHINLIVGLLSAVFIVLMLVVEIDRTRRAVSEEIRAANVVATQLLSRIAQTYERDGALPLLLFLKHLGRVRANEITLHDAQGTVLYRSPPATYKAGRKAPAWFSSMVLPDTTPRIFEITEGTQLRVEANASLAVLDGWDDLIELLWVGGTAFALLNVLVFWLVRRALSPLPVIASGLQRIEHGDLAYRLPPLPGYEAEQIGAAFNRMAGAVEEKWQAERKASEAQASLDENRELSQLIEQRLDEERRSIARELHDEFAQSVTAIRTLAVAIVGRQPIDKATLEAANTISNEAARLYDAMHSLIPRLAPIALDTLGLAETLQGLVEECGRRHPSTRISLKQDLPANLGSSVTLTIYRIVQEALINALRHAHASQIAVIIETTSDQLVVRVIDDGVGLAPDWFRPGQFGIRGLRERVTALDGELHIANRSPKGVELTATIPLADPTNKHSEDMNDSRATG